MNIYELYGRQAEALEQERAEHRRSVEVLRQVLSGELPAARVSVADGKWQIAAPVIAQEMPAAERP